MTPPAAAPAFLAAHGWEGATIAPLAGDASFRRYFRVHAATGNTAVLMDAPPDKEDSRPFLAIGKTLDAFGFSAPQPIAADLEQGLILLEDFGDRRVGAVLAREPEREAQVYATAIDILVALHAHPAPGIARYDTAELRREARLLPEWYLPAVGIAEAPGYDAAWDSLWPHVTAGPPVLTLRDYHADNLMIIDRPGVRGLGLLDFQDALAGHPAYDLASLLQDIRREVAPDLEAAMLDRYLARRSQVDAAAFRTAYDILATQRNVKILGIFTRLHVRDGKPGYLAYHPRLWQLIERGLARPALAPVAAWFAAHVPAAARLGVRA
ncbi:aminoglycoside phosphotransferase [alpha proteobacterium AAP81b]|nr:aminoglycoside phosphotransferase [alpha proteobacterium AAP81b]